MALLPYAPLTRSISSATIPSASSQETRTKGSAPRPVVSLLLRFW